MVNVARLIAPAFALGLLASPAAAANCGSTLDVFAGLVAKYNEAPRVQGLTAGENWMQVWLNPVTGSWTVTLTDARGKTCLLAAGKGGLEFPPAEPEGVDG